MNQPDQGGSGEKPLPLVSVRAVGKAYRVFGRPADRLLLPIKRRLRGMVGLRTPPPKLFHALRDVSFDIGKGETIGIVGRNGSGKSTLLQIIVGTMRASAGDVVVRGRVSALLELGAGFNPEFTGRENVYLAGAIIGMTASTVRELMPLIERFADIGEFIDQPVKTYSSGMYVRLAFSTAIHVSPDVLVVDEALAVGDVAFQMKCLTRIRKLQSEGVSIILVTHSMNTLLEFCDRAVYLRHGSVVLDGACRDVVKRYADDLVEEEGGAVVSSVQDAVDDDVGVQPTVDQAPVGASAAGVPGPSEIVAVELRDSSGKWRSTFNRGEHLTVLVRIRVHCCIQTPCYGVQIRSVDDIALWSGTTQSMQIDTSPTPPGEYMCRWDLRLDVGGNRYVIAVGAGDLDGGEYRRHSRLPYAGHVDVLPQPHEGYGWLGVASQFSLQREGQVT